MLFRSLITMDSLHALDEIRLNFSPNNLYALNIAIAFVMFGVALEIKLEHFGKLLKNPMSAFIGVFFTVSHVTIPNIFTHPATS